MAILVPGSGLDPRFSPALTGPDSLPEDSLVLAFRGARLLVLKTEDGGARPPSHGELDSVIDSPVAAPIHLGSLGATSVVAYHLPERTELRGSAELRGLRGLIRHLQEDHFWLAARAVQMVAWQRDHRFCGRCGGPTDDHDRERAKLCRRCKLSFYPRLSPAAIVLVERGDEMLLARSPKWPPGMHSTLAGFVEAGESVEHTIHREIREEVGVEVSNLRYFGSQPWPFPNSLMLGFRADYAGGEIEVDGIEIEHAAWYHYSKPPQIPPRVSIARSLIDSFIGERS